MGIFLLVLLMLFSCIVSMQIESTVREVNDIIYVFST